MPKPFLIVVDDDADMADLVAHVGETVGYEVAVADSGAAFKELLSGSPPPTPWCSTSSCPTWTATN